VAPIPSATNRASSAAASSVRRPGAGYTVILSPSAVVTDSHARAASDPGPTHSGLFPFPFILILIASSPFLLPYPNIWYKLIPYAL